jgi:hypothetical protein
MISIAGVGVVRTIGRALRGPASNFYVCGLFSLLTMALILLQVAVLASRSVFLVVAVLTAGAALVPIILVARTKPLALDRGLARATNSVGLYVGPADITPTVAAVTLYCAGTIGGIVAYAYLALAPSGIDPKDVIVQWSIQDKRPLFFGYIAVVGLVVFHAAMTRLFFAAAPVAVPVALSPVPRLSRIAGGVLIAVLAYGWLGASALQGVVPADDGKLAVFYDLHSQMHLGAFEQIRQGALPYLEARTQYGVGNQLLLYFLTQAIDYSNHGFHAAVLLLDVVCIVGFFVMLQQMLGLGWAVAALVGWALWPSPADVVAIVAGWATLTRWLAVPALALLLARLLLAPGPVRRGLIGALAIGAIWGLGSFFSQESMSGGLVVFVVSLALYGPVSGLSSRTLARFAALFVTGAAATYGLLVGFTIGFSHGLDVLRASLAQPNMVTAGVSNSVWSDDVGLLLKLDVVNNWLFPTFASHGNLTPVLQTYGFAVVIVVSMGLLARFLSRRWPVIDDRQRSFVINFAGVAVGAFALHAFTLLRSDVTHLAGSAFLLPLFLLMLPMFAWRCLRPGIGRGVFLAVSIGLVAQAAIASGPALDRRLGGLKTVWADSSAAFSTYRELYHASDRTDDIVSRYSPIARYQAPFREHPNFAESEEFIRLLREHLQGRPAQLAVPILNDLMTDPELIYFFGGFRSPTGITSFKSSLWLRAEQEAWIAEILGMKTVCVFYDSRHMNGRLFDAWMDMAKRSDAVTMQPIVGKRDYGVLSCRN